MNLVNNMKTCIKCDLPKNESEFDRDKRAKDGLQGQCKECGKKADHSRYLANRQLVLDRNAKWVKDNPERRAEIRAKGDREQKAKHPERIKARQAVYRAIKTGRLVKEPCHCGETEVQGHHEDYSKPLDVEWLCAKCHSKKEQGE